MKKNLQPLEMLLRGTLSEYKDSERTLNKKELINMLEDSIWLAPEYSVFRVCGLEAKQKYNGSGYSGFAVCYKNSGRKMRGGCYVGIEYIKTGTVNKTIGSLTVPAPVYSIVIREIIFNNEIL